MEELAELDPLCSEYSIYIPDTTLAHCQKAGNMNSISDHCKSIQGYFVFLKCLCSFERERNSAYV